MCCHVGTKPAGVHLSLLMKVHSWYLSGCLSPVVSAILRAFVTSPQAGPHQMVSNAPCLHRYNKSDLVTAVLPRSGWRIKFWIRSRGQFDAIEEGYVNNHNNRTKEGRRENQRPYLLAPTYNLYIMLRAMHARPHAVYYDDTEYAC